MKNINVKQIIVLVLAIAATALITLYAASRTLRPTAVEETQEAERKTAVVVTAAKAMGFERVAALQGNLESKNYALVSPRIMGTLEKFFVDEGDAVIANESKLFATDSASLEQTVEIRRRLLDIARSTKKQAVANLEKIQADFDKVELDYNRFKRLYEKGAVTADAFERQESQYKQLEAAIRAAGTNIELAESDIRKAEADLAISGKDLADTVIYAPISGKISKRFKELGEMGRPGEAAVRIDDPNRIEVSAYIPAQYYAEVTEGKTKMRIGVSGRDMGEYAISYKSPTINPNLRTFEVKCVLENPLRIIAAGTMAQVRLILETRDGLGVPTAAILNRDNQFVVFVVSGERAHKVAVEKGLENDGWTEVISKELNEQSMVVTMGQDMLDEGGAVSVQKENK
jgi:RND family efflux transporter MFP subunit